MKSIKLAASGLEVATAVMLADTFSTRLRGLLFRPPLRPEQALVITRCNQVHMFFMTFPIDVVFCSKDRQVLRCYQNLRPWRVTSICHGAAMAIEFAAGVIERHGIKAGDSLEFVN